MQVFTSVADVPADFGPSAVTIGKFDGVHAGHRAVIAELQAMAGPAGLVPTVVTFDRNPLALLRPELCPESLLSNPQKLERLAEVGIGATLMLTFDLALSQESPEEFIQSVLVEALHAKIVLVGADFRFGSRGAGTVDTLIEAGSRYGFEVRRVHEVLADSGRRASSTWVREALARGDIREASAVLGHLPSVRSIVVPGERRGREMGFPTANLKPGVEGLIPADGVYAGWLTVDGTVYPAAISIGDNPTFEGVPARQVEAYVLDEDIDLYGKTVEVSFFDRLRGMVKYTTIEALIEQLKQDVDDTRVLLTEAPLPGREGTGLPA
jgi:riboflavin kinase/FMN adenylyltransferase